LSTHCSHNITSCDHLEVDGLVKRMIHDEKRFTKIWIIERAYMSLGHIVVMVGHWDTNLISICLLHQFPLIFCFLGYEPQTLISIHKDVVKVVILNHPNVWVEVYEQCVALFKRVMPMVMENLVITQYRYILWYVTIYGYGQCSNV
jgi:hypothetical protein